MSIFNHSPQSMLLGIHKSAISMPLSMFRRTLLEGCTLLRTITKPKISLIPMQQAWIRLKQASWQQQLALNFIKRCLDPQYLTCFINKMTFGRPPQGQWSSPTTSTSPLTRLLESKKSVESNMKTLSFWFIWTTQSHIACFKLKTCRKTLKRVNNLNKR